MSVTTCLERRWRGLAAAVAVMSSLLAACLPAQSPGERLYRRHCASCHGVDGGGGLRYMVDEGADLLDDVWRYGGAPSQIEYSLISEEVRNHRTWDFTSQERLALVDHILYLRGERR